MRQIFHVLRTFVAKGEKLEALPSKPIENSTVDMIVEVLRAEWQDWQTTKAAFLERN